MYVFTLLQHVCVHTWSCTCIRTCISPPVIFFFHHSPSSACSSTASHTPPSPFSHIPSPVSPPPPRPLPPPSLPPSLTPPPGFPLDPAGCAYEWSVGRSGREARPNAGPQRNTHPRLHPDLRSPCLPNLCQVPPSPEVRADVYIAALLCLVSLAELTCTVYETHTSERDR